MAALLALFASLVWGGSDFIGGVVSRRVRSIVVVGLAHAAAVAAMLVVAAATGSLKDNVGYVPWAVGAGAAGCVGLIAFYRALATGTMGVVAPVAGTGVVVPVAFGLARGEAPSGLQIAGIAVAVAGVVLASGPELAGAGGRRPVGLALIAAVGFGLVYVMIDRGAAHSVVMTLLMMRVTSMSMVGLFVGACLLARAWPRDDGLPRGRDLSLIAVVGWADIAANGLYGVASQHGLVSVVSVLASLYPAVTVVLARLLENERMRRIQGVGVVFALCGIVLLAAG